DGAPPPVSPVPGRHASTPRHAAPPRSASHRRLPPAELHLEELHSTRCPATPPQSAASRRATVPTQSGDEGLALPRDLDHCADDRAHEAAAARELQHPQAYVPFPCPPSRLDPVCPK